jgi:hypothetical protein
MSPHDQIFPAGVKDAAMGYRLLSPAQWCMAVTVCLELTSVGLAQELNWAEKMFEVRNLDFGVVARGATVNHRLKVTNLYQEQINISNVSTSCGCSAAKPSGNSIPSGESAYIEISMDTQRFMREKTSAVLVTLTEPTKGLRQEVRIPLKVYIRTDVVFTPGSANFGAIDLGAGSEKKMSIAYAGRNDWQILRVESPKPYIEGAAVLMSRPNTGLVNYDLKVILKPDAPAGAFREELVLITDDQANPRVPLLVEGRVEPDIVVSPELLALGSMSAGQSKTMSLVVRGKKPFRIEKIECTNALDCFKVKLPAEEKMVHVLPITFTAPTDVASIDEKFTISIVGRPEPVTFRAQGKIVAPAGSGG